MLLKQSHMLLPWGEHSSRGCPPNLLPPWSCWPFIPHHFLPSLPAFPSCKNLAPSTDVPLFSLSHLAPATALRGQHLNPIFQRRKWAQRVNDLPKVPLPVTTTTPQKEPPTRRRCTGLMLSTVLCVLSPIPEPHALVVQAAVTKGHSQGRGGLNTDIGFSRFWRLRTPRSRCQHGGFWWSPRPGV